MSTLFDTNESDEFAHVFGDVREPMMRAYYENLLSIIRSRYTHEQIMDNQYTMPTGYGPGDTIATIVRVIAAVVAYIPVFGTAVAFVLNVATSLAQGENIDNVMLDAIGGSLPGQPASRMCFDAVRAVAEGKEIDEILISALPVDESVKKYVVVAAQVARQIAEGQTLDKVALTQLYNQLPPEGQKAMAIAQRVANGENVGDVAMTEAAVYAIQQGQQAVNGFVAAAGYQGIIKTLPDDIANAVTSGNVVGTARRIQSGWTPGQKFSAEELQQQVERASIKLTPFEKLLMGDATSANRALELEGQQIANNVTIVWQLRGMSSYQGVTINSDWRRGFDIGTALSQGKTYPSTADKKVRNALLLTTTQKGFDAASALQYKLTAQKADMTALGRMISTGDRITLEQFAAKGRVIASANSQVTAARNLQADGRYRWGFDVGSAVCQGSSIPGPGQTAWRTKVGPFSGGSGPNPADNGSNEAIQGFDTAQALQHGITKGTIAAPGALGAGTLIAQGLAGSGSSTDVKVNALTSAANNPNAQAGVDAVVAKQEGFFHKIAVFLGLA